MSGSRASSMRNPARTVQLARDPRTLLRDGHAGGRLAVAFGLARAFLRSLVLRDPLAQREADEPGDREQRRDEDEVAGRVGVVETTIAAPPTTTARPNRAWRPSGTWASRNAAAIPATVAPAVNSISRSASGAGGAAAAP
jgi:hypothetical protein